eukprot:scaffold429292_cov38-Prasinocladus_malaysianus.AAC.1
MEPRAQVVMCKPMQPILPIMPVALYHYDSFLPAMSRPGCLTDADAQPTDKTTEVPDKSNLPA